jgi:hypothetical protein
MFKSMAGAAARVPRTRSSHGFSTGRVANFGFKSGTQIIDLLVPRTRSSHDFAAGAFANFGFKSGTRIIELLVSFSIPKFAQRSRRTLANFGIGTLAATLVAISQTDASAHCFVGGRFFPATLAIDDPCVADELSIPTVSWFRTSDDPSARETDVSIEYSKRITDTFGVSIGSTWTHLALPGMPSQSGFQNVETTFKYQFLTLTQSEFVMSAAIVAEWGNTGGAGVGAESFTTYTPTLYFGKGFGDLPDSFGWLTGQVGYAIPSRSSSVTFDPDTGDADVELRPRFLTYGFSLQYSMPYLKSSVVDLGLPDFINHLIPIVEGSFQTPVSNAQGTGLITTGTINPGVIWVGDYFQVAVEAIVPINRQSGTGIGGMVQLHLYLDDIFPKSIGAPLFSTAANQGRPIFGN